MTENTNQIQLEIVDKEYEIRGRASSNTGKARSASDQLVAEADRTGWNMTKMIGGSALTVAGGIAWHRWGKARANCIKAQAQLADDFINQADELAKIGQFNDDVARSLKTQQGVITKLEEQYRNASLAQKPRLAAAVKSARAELYSEIVAAGIPEAQIAIQNVDEVTRTFISGMASATDDAARLAALRGFSSNPIAQEIVKNADDVAKQATAMKEALATRKGISAQTRSAINSYLDDVIKNPTSFNPAKLSEIAVDGSGKSLITGKMTAPFEAAKTGASKLASFGDDVAKLYAPYQNIGKITDLGKGFTEITDMIAGSGYKVTSKAIAPAIKGEVKLLEQVGKVVQETIEQGAKKSGVKLASQSSVLGKMTSFVNKAAARGVPIAGIALGAGMALHGATDQFAGFDLDDEQKVAEMMEVLKQSPDIEFKEDTYTQEQKKAMVDWAIENTTDATQKEILNGIKDNGYDYAKYLISTGDMAPEHRETNEWSKELNKLIQSTANAEFFTMLEESQKEVENLRAIEAEHQAAENTPDENVDTQTPGTIENTPTEPANIQTPGAVENTPTEPANTQTPGAVENTPTEPTNTQTPGTIENTPTEPANTQTPGAVENTPTEPTGPTNGKTDDTKQVPGTHGHGGSNQGTGGSVTQTLDQHGQKINPEGIKFVPTKINTADLINSL